jgi:hypothetical protein
MKKPRVLFEIDDEKLRDALKAYAISEGRTMKYIIKDAFVKYLEKYAK